MSPAASCSTTRHSVIGRKPPRGLSPHRATPASSGRDAGNRLPHSAGSRTRGASTVQRFPGRRGSRFLRRHQAILVYDSSVGIATFTATVTVGIACPLSARAHKKNQKNHEQEEQPPSWMLTRVLERPCNASRGRVVTVTGRIKLSSSASCACESHWAYALLDLAYKSAAASRKDRRRRTSSRPWRVVLSNTPPLNNVPVWSHRDVSSVDFRVKPTIVFFWAPRKRSSVLPRNTSDLQR